MCGAKIQNRVYMVKYKLEYHITRKAVRVGKSSTEIKAELCQVLDLSMSQINRIINYRIGSKKTITGDQLAALANYFDCTMESIINNHTHEIQTKEEETARAV